MFVIIKLLFERFMLWKYENFQHRPIDDKNNYIVPSKYLKKIEKVNMYDKTNVNIHTMKVIYQENCKQSYHRE